MCNFWLIPWLHMAEVYAKLFWQNNLCIKRSALFTLCCWPTALPFPVTSSYEDLLAPFGTDVRYICQGKDYQLPNENINGNQPVLRDGSTFMFLCKGYTNGKLRLSGEDCFQMPYVVISIHLVRWPLILR